MSGYDNKTWGNLKDYVSREEVYYVTGSGPQASLKVSNITTPEAVQAKISKWAEFNVYTKANVPDHLHFKNHRNNLDVLMVSKGKELVWTGFGGSLSFDKLRMLEDRQFVPIPEGTGRGGTHGWDDTSPSLDEYQEGPMPDMRAIFMARGPGIDPNNKVVSWIKLVDEYQLFCYLLNITPEPHNGTWDRVDEFIVNSPNALKVKSKLIKDKSAAVTPKKFNTRPRKAVSRKRSNRIKATQINNRRQRQEDTKNILQNGKGDEWHVEVNV